MKPNPMMPLRVLCYDAGTFAAQMAEQRAIRRSTDPEFRKTADDAIVPFSKTASGNPLRPAPSSLQDQVFLRASVRKGSSFKEVSSHHQS